VAPARIETKEMMFLYKSDEDYVFMDNATFEQMTLREDFIGDGVKYLKENMNVLIQMYNNEAIGVNLPNTVELTVVQTEPGFKGDTATGGTKPATMETGVVVNVPLFIEEGDILQIDTRTGEYLRRSK
jgi:elongation factor P